MPNRSCHASQGLFLAIIGAQAACRRPRPLPLSMRGWRCSPAATQPRSRAGARAGGGRRAQRPARCAMQPAGQEGPAGWDGPATCSSRLGACWHARRSATIQALCQLPLQPHANARPTGAQTLNGRLPGGMRACSGPRQLAELRWQRCRVMPLNVMVGKMLQLLPAFLSRHMAAQRGTLVCKRAKPGRLGRRQAPPCAAPVGPLGCLGR
jgi:hypothetical protein